VIVVQVRREADALLAAPALAAAQTRARERERRPTDAAAPRRVLPTPSRPVLSAPAGRGLDLVKHLGLRSYKAGTFGRIIVVGLRNLRDMRGECDFVSGGSRCAPYGAWQ